MSKIQTKLASVKVTKGEGVGEGDFELQLEVNGDGGSVTWPAPGSTAKVDNNCPALPIYEVINTYTVNAPVTKQYRCVWQLHLGSAALLVERVRQQFLGAFALDLVLPAFGCGEAEGQPGHTFAASAS